MSNINQDVERQKIAAVIVTYNRNELLVENIDKLLQQELLPDKIMIIDNHSSDHTREVVENRYKKYKDIIDYYYLDENLGGAGGFEIGSRRAYEQGFDLIWLMDDDGKPFDNYTLSNLLVALINQNLVHKPAILNSLVLADEETLAFTVRSKKDYLRLSKNGLIKNDINPFNGTLITKETYDLIGFPNGAFFIKGDEMDFYWRARKANVEIYTVINSRYQHPKGPIQYKRVFGKTIHGNAEAPWKEYYKTRNYIYTALENGSKTEAGYIIFKELLTVLMFGNKKTEGIKMVIKGSIDGIKGKLGPTVKP